MSSSPIDRHLFVILGATGSLSTLKLLPALFSLMTQKGLSDQCYILGVGTKNLGDKGFKNKAREALEQAGFSAGETGDWCDSYLYYQTLEQSVESYSRLIERIQDIERTHRLPGNRVFYLALPPSIFPAAIKGIGEKTKDQNSGWTRIVIEKPFGYDLSSARELNQLVHRYFGEDQVFRIDHYLGKETIQNLLIFRFANTIFESLWNRDRVESVEVTVAESIGIGNRARYYDQAGALRDIVQNHLAQLISLIAMEVPAVFAPEYIRNEKIKVLHSIAPIRAEDVVYGQYAAGQIEEAPVSGYLEERGVEPQSKTETYVAMQLKVDNWRWQGVPFFVRTGKRLPQRVTHILVSFRHPPICMFRQYSGCQIQSNKLLITLQPDEGFHLYFDVKEPEETLKVRTEKLHFHYKDAFGPLPEAYKTLILDVIRGDQTLFVRSDELEASWELFTPLLAGERSIFSYPAGTWGPEEADKLIARKGNRWWNQ